MILRIFKVGSEVIGYRDTHWMPPTWDVFRYNGEVVVEPNFHGIMMDWHEEIKLGFVC